MQDFPIFRPEKYTAFHSRLKRSTSPTQTYSPLRYSSPPQMTSTLNNVPHMVSSLHDQSTISKKQTIQQSPIKGESRIEYIPIQKTVIDYVDSPKYHVIPRKRTVTDYAERIRVDVVPRQVTTTDYYAVENLRYYIPQVIQEKTQQYVPKERKNIKYEYIPVERKILHYPKHSHEDQRPRYLGVNDSQHKQYDNLRESDLKFWEREYGWMRGESIETLNKKIRQKHEAQKQAFFHSITSANESLRREHARNH